MIPIVAVPRMSEVSSSAIRLRLTELCLQDMEFFSRGVSGSVVSLYEIESYKPLCYAAEDMLSRCTDAFHFFEERCYRGEYRLALPRQYKHLGESNLFPNIAGIHPDREIMVNEFFLGQAWNPFIKVVAQPSFQTEADAERTNITDLELFGEQVARSRSSPVHIAWLVTRYAGTTLNRFAKTCSQSEFTRVFHAVTAIINTIRSYGVVHGDIHAGNILVHPASLQVSIIDWGWVSASFLPMSAQEKR